MSKLTVEQLHNRLRFDFRIIQQMSNSLVSVASYPDGHSLQAQVGRITEENLAARAVYYRASFFVKSLIGPGQYHNHFDMSVDLMAGGSYPFSAPVVHVISQPIPWSPHFAPNVPVCIGEFWVESKGRATLGHLVAHLTHLLNWDEQDRGGGYGGYNPQSIQYWKKHLKQQPITPGLAYPTLPTELTHDEPTRRTPVFLPRQPAAPATLFRPVQ